MRNTLNFLLIIIFFLSCTKPVKKTQFGGEIQGTYYKIVYFDRQERNFHHEIDSLLHEFDKTASLWVKNSMINRINNNDSTVVLNQDFINLFQISKQVYEWTDGAFNPAIGGIVNIWGFGAKGKQEPDSSLIDSLLLFSDFNSVHITENLHLKKDIPALQFDFNAIAQGYSVDLVGQFLEKEGIHNFLIDIGGELLAKGQKPQQKLWTVGIESPHENSHYGDQLQTSLKLKDKAIATSGSYRKFYVKDGVKYSHTIDPNTGYPVNHNLLSASVITDDCASADAIATALMVMGTEKAIQFSKNNPKYRIYLISDNNGEFVTYEDSLFKQQYQN